MKKVEEPLTLQDYMASCWYVMIISFSAFCGASYLHYHAGTPWAIAPWLAVVGLFAGVNLVGLLITMLIRAID